MVIGVSNVTSIRQSRRSELPLSHSNCSAVTALVLYCPSGNSLEERKDVSLYFCRDVILSPFYNFHTAVYLYPSETFPPLILSPHLTPFVSCVSKYPYFGSSLSSCVPGILYSFEGLSIPERIHFNYISPSKRLLPPLLSRRLPVFLHIVLISQPYIYNV